MNPSQTRQARRRIYMLAVLMVAMLAGCGGGGGGGNSAAGTAPTPTPTPTPAPAPTGVTYLGCYADSASRALPTSLLAANASVTTCTQAAKAQGLAYAGLQYSGQCWGGNALSSTKLAESECNLPCAADASQICGGSFRNSVYATGIAPTSPPPVPVPPPITPPSPAPSPAPAAGPLRVDTKNHSYFSDGSKVVFLTGSHTWQTFKDRSLMDPPAAFDYDGYLDFMVARNHNFFRLWTWEQPHSWNNNTDNLSRYFTPFPWPRTGPAIANDGKPAFDLSKFDQTYFDRMRARISDAGKRGIYVAVTLFNGWDVVRAFDASKGGFPYGAGNNVNGIASGGTESQHLTNDAVTKVQEAYVKKVIDTVNDLDNVLYEIANETDDGGIPWQYHMIDFIKRYEATKPKQHPVGMTCTFPGGDSDLMRSNADWISPCSRLFPADGTKVVMNDSDHSFYWPFLKQAGQGPQQIWVWQNLTVGASAMFMDPYLEVWGGRNAPNGNTLDPYWDVIRNAIGHAHRYAQKMDLELAVPSPSLSSTGFCLANPGSQYLAYQPGTGDFSLTVLAGTYQYEWFNPSTGNVAGSGSIQLPAGAHLFSPPFSGDAVLYLTR